MIVVVVVVFRLGMIIERADEKDWHFIENFNTQNKSMKILWVLKLFEGNLMREVDERHGRENGWRK